MTEEKKIGNFTLEPVDRDRLANLIGSEDENLKQIQDRLGVSISYSGAHFLIDGSIGAVKKAQRIIKQLYIETAPIGKNKKPRYITPDEVNLVIIENTHLEADNSQAASPEDFFTPQERLEEAENARAKLKSPKGDKVLEEHERGSVGELYHKASVLKTQRGVIKARTSNQAAYISKILTHDVNFGIGPAGTGKTFLAVAAAVDSLTRNEVRRIILTRPAVEAGEKLGFLPGDLSQKVDPYLRPLYDALFEMLGFEKVEKLIERQVIEIAPLAYMRGRTLNDSFIILDEAQNTTIEQMKMFLTRIGFNSKAVITGDPSQVDLPRNVRSGLKHAMEVLSNVDKISFTYFISEDVVRHPVVAAIVNAYDAWDKKQHALEERKEAKDRKIDSNLKDEGHPHPIPEHKGPKPEVVRLEPKEESEIESSVLSALKAMFSNMQDKAPEHPHEQKHSLEHEDPIKSAFKAHVLEEKASTPQHPQEQKTSLEHEDPIKSAFKAHIFGEKDSAIEEPKLEAEQPDHFIPKHAFNLFEKLKTEPTEHEDHKEHNLKKHPHNDLEQNREQPIQENSIPSSMPLSEYSKKTFDQDALAQSKSLEDEQKLKATKEPLSLEQLSKFANMHSDKSIALEDSDIPEELTLSDFLDFANDKINAQKREQAPKFAQRNHYEQSNPPFLDPKPQENPINQWEQTNQAEQASTSELNSFFQDLNRDIDNLHQERQIVKQASDSSIDIEQMIYDMLLGRK